MNKRNTKPEAGNKFYIKKANGGYSTCVQGSPTDKDCNVLANCVGYACGRFNEIIGEMKYPSLNCNAENFIERAKSIGLKISNKPTLGGIMVWQYGKTLSGNDGAGHVAVVEEIVDDNNIYTSESNWGGKAFVFAKRSNKNGRWGLSNGFTFRGCIINPSVKEPVPEPIPEPIPNPVEPKFKVGDKVVPTKLINWKGTKLIQYDDAYTITELDNKTAVLSAPRKGKMEVWARMNISDIKLKD